MMCKHSARGQLALAILVFSTCILKSNCTDNVCDPATAHAQHSHDETCRGYPEANARSRVYYWSHQKGNVNRTGLSSHAVPRDLKFGESWRWVDPHGGVNRNTALIDDKSNIYVATLMGHVYKFSQNGTIVWEYVSRWGALPHVPALMDGAMFCSSAHGVVFAIDMESGDEVWASNVSSTGTSGDTACLLAVDGIVVTATRLDPKDPYGGNHAIVALDSVSGHELWLYDLDVPVYNFQASAPGDGTIVFMTRDGSLYRLWLRTGKLIWSSGIPEPKPHFFTTAAAVVGPNGMIYCASNTDQGGVIHAYKVSDGSPVWTRVVGLYANQAVAVGNIFGKHGLAVTVGIGANPGLPLFLILQSWGIPLFCVSLICWALPSCVCGKKYQCMSECGLALAFFPSVCWALWFWQGLPSTGAKDWLFPALVNTVQFTWLMIVACRLAITLPFFNGQPVALAYKLVLRPIQLCLLAVCAYAVAYGLHKLCLHMEAQPTWLWHGRHMENQLVALDAETGSPIWTFAPQPFKLLAAAGDEENLLARMWAGKGDAICLPDSWSQNTIDGDGKVHVGFQDGHIYSVWDADGDGHIVEDSEVSKYDFGHAFQASPAHAPGMLAAVPCGGGLYVWLSENK